MRAGEGNTAETLLFDSVHSGQLAVRRLTAGPQPLLQLDLPLLPPEDPLPAGLDADHVIDVRRPLRPLVGHPAAILLSLVFLTGHWRAHVYTMPLRTPCICVV